jgi:membrane associated rhomboid family serine protease
MRAFSIFHPARILYCGLTSSARPSNADKVWPNMIPIRDTNPSRKTPVVNFLLIASCVLLFLYQLQLGRQLEPFLFQYGLVPVRITRAEIAQHFSLMDQIVPFFSSMFLHGGWLHLIGNMWVLYIFGDNIESELGHVQYVFFYLLCGLTAAAIQVITNPGSGIPTIGASGAIGGVMGAYFVLYPRAKILALVPIVFFFTLVQVPAYFFLGFWFVLQFFSGTLALVAQAEQYAGIAWWAHIGGFVGGIIFLYIFKAGPSRDVN